MSFPGRDTRYRPFYEDERCPVCGAPPKEPCTVGPFKVRSKPHHERVLLATLRLHASLGIPS